MDKRNNSVIDYYSYISKIRHWNSAYKVAVSFITLILCISLNNIYVSSIVIVVMSYITVIKGGVSILDYFRILLIPIIFIILGTIAIGFDFSIEQTGQYNIHLGLFYLYTSNENLKEMFFLILKVFAAICALQMSTLSTPSSEFIAVFRKVGIPKLIVELMNMIYRFIFILSDVYFKMKNAAQSRQGYSDFKTSCFTFGNIISNLLVVSLKRANKYYDAMESRCYEGELCFLEDEKPIKVKQVLLLIVFIVFLITIKVFT